MMSTVHKRWCALLYVALATQVQPSLSNYCNHDQGSQPNSGTHAWESTPLTCAQQPPQSVILGGREAYVKPLAHVAER